MEMNQLPDSNDQDGQTPQGEEASGIASLSKAFEARLQEQEGTGSTQDGQQGVESSDDNSRQNSGTSPSRSAEETPTKESILASLTLDDLRAVPDLWSKVQSHADSVAAAQLRGKTNQIRQQVTDELELERAKAHFEELSKEELAQELAQNPEAVDLYTKVQAAPPPPKPEDVDFAVQQYTNIIRGQVNRIQSSNLSDDDKAALDPQKFLVIDDTQDPNEAVQNWISQIDAKIAGSGTNNEDSRRAKEIEEAAKRDEQEPQSPLSQNGIRKEPVPDIIGNRGRVLLEDAFRRQTSGSR